MNKIEFYKSPDGEIRCIIDGAKNILLNQQSREVIEEVLGIVQKKFPKTWTRLHELHANKNLSVERFRMASHFIACNFGEFDTLRDDIVYGKPQFEEVRCPLRGKHWLCPHEGVICKPYKQFDIPKKQREIFIMFKAGMKADEIAKTIGKSLSTVKNTINNARKRFHFENSHLLLAFLTVNDIL